MLLRNLNAVACSATPPLNELSPFCINFNENDMDLSELFHNTRTMLDRGEGILKMIAFNFSIRKNLLDLYNTEINFREYRYTA